MDWSKLPDFVAVGLLAWAFASVARKSPEPVSAHWLWAWLLVVLHFFALMFAPLSASLGPLFELASLLTLAWAGIFFTRASIPYRSEKSSVAMVASLLFAYTFYIVALVRGLSPVLNVAAILMGAAPLAVTLIATGRGRTPLRWVTVGLQTALSVVLLIVQRLPNGADFALNALFFTIYLAATIHFAYIYRRTSAGACITIVGFFLWANVFTVAPSLANWYSQLHLENEVWNIPKYVVAIGMILVLLENQIAHNRHLALHDALTGLPNRRLFHDRLSIALERARRSGTQTALLMLDLDRFKEVNDTLGHHTGDLLLQRVAGLFAGRVRRSDTVARTGGDEFAVILEGPATRHEAQLVGRSLLSLLDQPICVEGHQISVGASFGIALFPDDATDQESLCIKADLRMYENKRATNKLFPFGPVSESSIPRDLHKDEGAIR